MSDPVPTVLTGVHVAGRDDRLSHIELRHGAEPKKEDAMTEAQFAELKAMLEPIAEVAAMQLAEYRRREAEKAEWEAKAAQEKADADAKAEAEEAERQAKIVADKRAAAEKQKAEREADLAGRAEEAAAAAEAAGLKDKTKD